MKSDEIGEIAAALAKAREEIKHPKWNRDATAKGGRQYKYADLSSVIDAVIPVLAKHGIAVTQLPDEGSLTTVMMHSSGQWISGLYPLPTNASPQEMGSAITYARRYSLSAMAGVASEEDDDAEHAEKGAAAKPVPAKDIDQPIPAKQALVTIRDTLLRDHRDLVRGWVGGENPTKKQVMDAVAQLLKEEAAMYEFTSLGQLLPEEIPLFTSYITSVMQEGVLAGGERADQ